MKLNLEKLCHVISAWVFVAFIFLSAWAFAEGIKAIWIPCFIILFCGLSIFMYIDLPNEDE